jgi:hypothetical protein
MHREIAEKGIGRVARRLRRVSRDTGIKASSHKIKLPVKFCHYGIKRRLHENIL